MIKIIQPFAPRTKPSQPGRTGLGDMVERVAKPIAKALKMNCLDPDKQYQLRPESPCAKRRDKLNKLGEKVGIGLPSESPK